MSKRSHEQAGGGSQKRRKTGNLKCAMCLEDFVDMPTSDMSRPSKIMCFYIKDGKEHFNKACVDSNTYCVRCATEFCKKAHACPNCRGPFCEVRCFSVVRPTHERGKCSFALKKYFTLFPPNIPRPVRQMCKQVFLQKFTCRIGKRETEGRFTFPITIYNHVDPKVTMEEKAALLRSLVPDDTSVLTQHANCFVIELPPVVEDVVQVDV